MSSDSLLIIAYGNSLRRDDGAGLRLARKLASAWQQQGIRLKLLEVQQLLPELAWEMAQPEVGSVLFVDTCDAEQVAVQGTVESISSEQFKTVAGKTASPSLGHQLDPLALCLYAQHLYHRRPSAWLMTVPGYDFAHGEGLSEQACKALGALYDKYMSPAKMPPWLEVG